jgi:hypothetical protein
MKIAPGGARKALHPNEKKSNPLNAVEIEEAISAAAEQPFDAQEFPFAFLQAFGNKETTIKRLRSGTSNKSDLGGVLQTNNIHIAISPPSEVTKTLVALKSSSATTKAKARFILATDGMDFEAEDLDSGETVACAYRTSRTTSASFCRWPESPPSNRSAKALSTSGQQAVLTGSMSSS